MPKAPKSRHTHIGSVIARSYGFDPETGRDLVVEMSKDKVEFRKEPTDCRLTSKARKDMPCLTLDVKEVMENLAAPEAFSEKESEVVEIIEGILKKMPIASFEESNPKSIAYEMKVWCMRELERVVKELRE